MQTEFGRIKKILAELLGTAASPHAIYVIEKQCGIPFSASWILYYRLDSGSQILVVTLNFGGSTLNSKNKGSRFHNQKFLEFRRLDHPTQRGDHPIVFNLGRFCSESLNFNLPEHTVMMKVNATMFLIGEQTCFCSIDFIAHHFSEYYTTTGVN